MATALDGRVAPLPRARGKQASKHVHIHKYTYISKEERERKKAEEKQMCRKERNTRKRVFVGTFAVRGLTQGVRLRGVRKEREIYCKKGEKQNVWRNTNEGESASREMLRTHAHANQVSLSLSLSSSTRSISR